MSATDQTRTGVVDEEPAALDPSGPGLSERGRGLADAIDEIKRILEEAESAAALIWDEARTEARHYRKRRQQEADELVARRSRTLLEAGRSLASELDRMRADNDELLRELNEIAGGLPTGEAPPGSSIAALNAAVALPAAVGHPTAAVAADHVPAEPESPGAAEATEAAVLRATQLVVSGRERAEVEGVLRREFGIAAPAKIVEEILGPTVL